MHLEVTRLAVGVVMSQGRRNGAERDFFPGNLVLTEQRDLKAFGARTEIEVQQSCAVEDVHLIDMRY